MVFAAINACPVPGGKLKSVDEFAGRRRARASCKVVRLDDAVAVVATGSYWRAKQALARLQPEWDVGAAGTRRQRAALEGRSARRSSEPHADRAQRRRFR